MGIISELGLDNPDLYHLWAESMNIANIDRYTYIGDVTFEKDYTAELSSQEFADKRVKTIDMNKARGKVKAADLVNDHGSTTHVSIVDKDGNAVSMTNTIGNFFGYGISPEGTGFMMNSHSSLFSSPAQYPINEFEPGKRPRSTMSPTIVLDENDNVFLVVGTPGGSRILTTIPLIISNIIDHGMDVQEAIDYPRIEKNGGKLAIEGGIAEEIIEDLEERGHKVIEKENNDLYFGGAHVIEVNHENNVLIGGADKRRDGKALGY